MSAIASWGGRSPLPRNTAFTCGVGTPDLSPSFAPDLLSPGLVFGGDPYQLKNEEEPNCFLWGILTRAALVPLNRFPLQEMIFRRSLAMAVEGRTGGSTVGPVLAGKN
ncbi:MAG: hypothetical protein M1829_000989 [Trizodia sp. TS-e1964]|nr:MAG: hypothetical protein M1829_000989 [Trizodia sp. TS-e1964]